MFFFFFVNQTLISNLNFTFYFKTIICTYLIKFNLNLLSLSIIIKLFFSLKISRNAINYIRCNNYFKHFIFYMQCVLFFFFFRTIKCVLFQIINGLYANSMSKNVTDSQSLSSFIQWHSEITVCDTFAYHITMVVSVINELYAKKLEY